MGRALAKIIKLETQKLGFRAYQGGGKPPPDKQPRFAGKNKKGQQLRSKNKLETEQNSQNWINSSPGVCILTACEKAK